MAIRGVSTSANGRKSPAQSVYIHSAPHERQRAALPYLICVNPCTSAVHSMSVSELPHPAVFRAQRAPRNSHLRPRPNDVLQTAKTLGKVA